MTEELRYNGRLAGYVVRGGSDPETTTFVTGPDAAFQLGFVVRGSGEQVDRHVHLPVTRELSGTAEALLVRSGRCLLDVYGEDESLATTVELQAGDLCLLLGGGHGFRMLEDTVLLELKQGPYAEGEDKKRF